MVTEPQSQGSDLEQLSDGETFDSEGEEGTIRLNRDRTPDNRETPEPRTRSFQEDPRGSEDGEKEEEKEGKGCEGVADVLSTGCYDDLDYNELMEADHYERGQPVRNGKGRVGAREAVTSPILGLIWVVQWQLGPRCKKLYKTTCLTLYQPMTHICVMSSHKNLYGGFNTRR